MFHVSPKQLLLILIPCLLVIGAMMPLAAFAKSTESGQFAQKAVRSVVNLANIVKDGGFEKPILGGGFTEYGAGQNVGKWAISSGSVDLVTASYWTPAKGNQSLDLNGSDQGAISQNLPTASGTSYTLSFEMAGNPVCGPQVVQMEVMWGSTIVDTLSFDTTGHSTSSMGWQPHTYSVQGTGSTTSLSFVSLTSGLCGPTLDSVSVK